MRSKTTKQRQGKICTSPQHQTTKKPMRNSVGEKSRTKAGATRDKNLLAVVIGKNRCLHNHGVRSSWERFSCQQILVVNQALLYVRSQNCWVVFPWQVCRIISKVVDIAYGFLLGYCSNNILLKCKRQTRILRHDKRQNNVTQHYTKEKRAQMPTASTRYAKENPFCSLQSSTFMPRRRI